MGSRFGAIVAAAALVLALAWPASAQMTRIDHLEVVSAGFTGAGEKIERGRIRRMFSRTPAVNAQKGTAFTVVVRPVGTPKAAEVKLRWVWRAPRPGVMDMKTGKLNRRVIEETTAKIGDETQRSYEFKEANDIVLGNWRVEVWSGARRLAVRRFAVQ